MAGYLIRRTLQAIVVIFFVMLGVFLLSQFIPGGECKLVEKVKATPAECRIFNRENGLNLPIWRQYWRYMFGLIVHRNFGYSYFYNENVRYVIQQRLPKTLSLVGVSTIISLMIAIPVGIMQVVRRNTWIDYSVTGVTFVLYAMPPFLLGTLLILALSQNTHVFPSSPPGNGTAWAIFNDPRAFVLPVVTLSAITIASFSRFMRSSMMDAMAEDYVRTARAKGAGKQRVLYGHALRNALIPILTLIGLSLPAIVSGALITESVFNYPGMGLLTVQAALNEDVPTLLGTTLVVTIATVIGSLLADILYAVADPRIRLGAGAL